MLSRLLTNIASCLIMCNAKNWLSSEQMITAQLMMNYDRISRPVLNRSEAVEVLLDPQLYSLIEIKVADQTLTLKQWLNMKWNDQNLVWEPDFYDGVDNIMVQRSAIWLPDIVISQQTSVSTVADNLSLARISSNGDVSIAMDQVVTLNCEFDVTDFPYDTQNCSVRYGSWMYTASQVDPYPMDPPDLSVFNENDEWTLRSYTVRKRTSMTQGDTFVDVYFDIKITRKPNYYITTFVWPSFLITCLSIIGVFSPFDDAGEREEKVTMGLTTLLTMAVILMIITGDMPKSSNGMPLLGVFIMLEIGISAGASIVSVYVLYQHRKWMHETPVPNWLQWLTLMAEKKRKKSSVSDATQAWPEKEHRKSKSDPKLTVNVNKGVESINLNIIIRDLDHESLREQWAKVTHRLDFIFMMIFLLANVLICAYILVIGNNMLDN